MSTQGQSEVPNARRIRLLNSRPFLLHYTHLKGGAGPTKGCGLCSGLLEEGFGVLEVEVADSGVRESGGVDEAGPASPARGTASWDDLFGKPGVPDEG